MLNFLEIKTETAKLAQRSEDEDYISKIGTWVNIAQQYLANVYDFYQELMDVYDFSSVDAIENYYMPFQFDKVLRVYDIENNKHLAVDTEFNYFDGNIANIADAIEGIPSVARVYGVSGVKRAISSSGTTVQVKSSSTSDVGGITIRIEGYLDSSKSILGYENVTVSTSAPTTYVAGVITFYKITKVSKDADSVGYITIADSSSNVLAELGQTDRVVQYKVMKLGLVPDDAYDYRVLFKQRVRKLVNNNDYPFLDSDEFIILDSLGYCYAQEKETMDRAVTMWTKANDVLNSILMNQALKHGPDYQHRMESTWMQAHRQ